MRFSPTLALVCVTALVASAAEPEPDLRWGTLVGKFLYDGPRPVPAALILPARLAANKPDPVDETLLVDAQGGLRNVVLYVRTKNVTAHPRRLKDLPAQPVLESKGMRFEPHILGLVKNQTLLVRNSDPFAINARITDIGGPEANPLLGPQKEFKYKFSRAQVVPQPVTSNLQPWYKAFVLPCDNPYFVISQFDGTIELHGLPLGELEFQAWHEVPGYLNTPDWPKGRFKLDIKPGENDLGTIKLPPKLFKR